MINTKIEDFLLKNSFLVLMLQKCIQWNNEIRKGLKKLNADEFIPLCVFLRYRSING